MKTVAEMWEHFESFLNPEISDIQRTEMQRCFYAGAGEMLHAILDIDEHAGSIDEAGKSIAALHDEIAFFGQQTVMNLVAGVKQ